MRLKIIPLFYCLLLAFLTLWVFSFATSPYYNIVHHGDSGLFRLIGKAWADGHLPYVDVWDSKGPLIFFVNAIGYMLPGNGVGVFVVQWVFLSVTLMLCYRFLREQYSMPWSLALLIVPLASYVYSFQGGDCVEEYILPFITLSYFLVYRWLVSLDNPSVRTHTAWYAAVYGFTFGFALMSRLTNALGVCGAVAVIGIWLIAKKSWKNLGANIVAFLGGFAVIVMPFVVYFAAKGALWDLWYGTILYNLDYTGSSGNANSLTTLTGYFRDTWLMAAVALIMLAYNIKARRRRVLESVTWIVAAVLSLLWFYKSNAFAHYSLISLPFIIVSLVEARRNFCVADVPKAVKVTVAVVFGVFVLYTLKLGYVTYTIIGKEVAYSEQTIGKFTDFMKGTPGDVYRSFVGYNIFSGFYVHENVFPACRFPCGQEWVVSRSSSCRKYMHHDFVTNKIRWILVYNDAEAIDDILRRDYHVYKTNHKDLTLYERNK